MERNGLAEPLLTADGAQISELARPHADCISMDVAQREFEKVTYDIRNAVNTGFVTLCERGMNGVERGTSRLNLTREGRKATGQAILPIPAAALF